MHDDIQHGGNIATMANTANCKPEELLDLSVNLNPLGPPLGAFECYCKAFEQLKHYPEPRAASLVGILSEKYQRDAADIVAGNGSNELISLLPGVLRPRRAILVSPGYQEYARACATAGITTELFLLDKYNDFALDCAALSRTIRTGDLVMLGSPNNPTGQLLDPAQLRALVAAHPQTAFFIDEAFIDFVAPEHSLVGSTLPNLVISRSFTKFYSLPGLRMGAMFGPAPLMDKIRALQGIWTMSGPAVTMAKFLLTLPKDYAAANRAYTKTLRESLTTKLSVFKVLKVYPSAANYLLVETPKHDLALTLLKEHKTAVRDCRDYSGLGAGFIRIAVCEEEQQERLQEALQAIFAIKPVTKRAKPTPGLMLQGTGSNAGKSVLTAAFGRILLQDGYSVAPFKAQNMALNSCVTHDGLEIGRAQAFQAEACRLDPDVRMNPLLLKPNSDNGSQVILRGKAIGNFNARDFYQNKSRFWETVKACYDSLAADYGVIVMEGAGSPAEVNLKQNDIVNMPMAAYAKAKVLLVGDIDRGGLYAAFAGTYGTFTLKERALLAGFVVNKFRGDRTLLADAHSYIQDLTGKPVLGVLDYLRDLRLPEEDSVSHGLLYDGAKSAQALDMALIVLPHIANFTDFDPLVLEPDVCIHKVCDVKDLGRPDVVIIPGTKNTMNDMAWLHANGLGTAITEAYHAGAWIIGVCGGLQILGARISDLHGIESGAGEIDGLNLLPFTTVMRPDKILCQSTATRQKDGAALKGYEIHHGQTAFSGNLSLHLRSDNVVIGMEGERLFASYLHGVFDDDVFRRTLLNEIRAGKGWPLLKGVTAVYETEESLNRLAAHVRERINMDYIYQLLGL